MKNFKFLLPGLLALAALSCSKEVNPSDPSAQENGTFSRTELARIFSQLPLGEEQLNEVYDAVNSSSGNGYDEEYLMSDLVSCPGAGVGEAHNATKASRYSKPIREIFAEYLSSRAATKAGAVDVEAYLNALSESDLQIYWPYSEDWDGTTYPIITFDPGYGAESNYGYEVAVGPDGARVVDSLLVTEELAMERPVWVINSNDDSAFTPLDMFTRAAESTAASSAGGKQLIVKNFTMLRNYDSWFGGASEFLVKCGAVDGFKASSDDDLKKYSPNVTDFVIVVKRKQLGKVIPLNTMLLSNFTDQMENLAFFIMEDDGGTTTNWKCSATVKVNSKSYGFDIEIPYKDKDDIVWRGQLARSFFTENGEVAGRFGDVMVTFEMK